MRTVAVLAVVLYHAGVPLLTGGYVGVDIFFVISGFLITGHLYREVERTGRIRLFHFYSRRFKRLLPPSFTVVLCTLGVGYFVLPQSALASLRADSFWAALYGINYHLALEGTDYQANQDPSPLQHYWSLAVEEQFYFIWPTVLIAVAAVVVARRYRRPATVAVLAVIFAVSLYLSITVTQSNAPMAYFSLQTRAWELAAGGLLALSLTQVEKLPDRALQLLGWAGLAAILVTVFWYDDSTPFPGTAALLPVLGTTAVIAGGTRLITNSVELRVLRYRPVQYIGRTSYAWYLWHWPMLILLPAFLGRDLALWERLEVVTIAFWFAVLTYMLENAAHRSSWNARRWLITGTAMSTTIIAATAVVGVFAPKLEGSGAALAAVKLRSADSSAVQATIAQAFNITAVPKNLTPKIESAALDIPWEGSAGCFASLAQTTPKACVFGAKDANRTAVLVGDSHSEQWLNALEVGARTHGWRIINFTKAACPVAKVKVWNQQLNRDYTECDAFKKIAWPEIQKIKPQLIIASEANAVGSGYAPSTWAKSTVQSLKSLASERTRVVFIRDTPYMKPEGNVCIEHHLDDVRKCIYLATANPKYVALDSAVISAIRASGIALVDTRPFFCNSANACPAVVSNMLVHRDYGHITRTYAQWLAPMLAPIFEEAK